MKTLREALAARHRRRTGPRRYGPSPTHQAKARAERHAFIAARPAMGVDELVAGIRHLYSPKTIDADIRRAVERYRCSQKN